MTIDTKTLISISEANQNFSVAAQNFCHKFSKSLSKIFSEIVPGKQTQKEGFRPLIF